MGIRTKGPRDKHKALALRKKEGRPRKIPLADIPIMKQMIEDGATNNELARRFGVTVGSICNYKADPDFFQPLKEAGEKAIERVKQSLYHRCLGYTFPSEKVFCTRSGTIKKVPTMEHIPPDILAMKFYLCNNDPANWSAKDQLNINQSSNQVNVNLSVRTEITDQERTRISRNVGVASRHGFITVPRVEA